MPGALYHILSQTILSASTSPKLLSPARRFRKTTFVNQASDRGISGDRKDLKGAATTVAMDLGWLHFKGFDITIYGTPGQPRFDPILPQLASHAMGVVMVIDVTRPEQMDRVRTLMELAKVNLIPMVIAANKCDLPHTMNEADIRNSLHLKAEVRYISYRHSGDQMSGWSLRHWFTV